MKQTDSGPSNVLLFPKRDRPPPGRLILTYTKLTEFSVKNQEQSRFSWVSFLLKTIPFFLRICEIYNPGQRDRPGTERDSYPDMPGFSFRAYPADFCPNAHCLMG